MKKKIKDLINREKDRICIKQRTCKKCPLIDDCVTITNPDKEVEVDNPFEALERIKSICINYMCGFTVVESSKESEKKINTDLNIIKEALEDHEMEHTLRIRLENINYELVREKQDNEKKLKALEIIKKYPKVPIQRLIAYENGKAKGYDIGTLEVNDIPYTQEEFNLLKEVLL